MYHDINEPEEHCESNDNDANAIGKVGACRAKPHMAGGDLAPRQWGCSQEQVL